MSRSTTTILEAEYGPDPVTDPTAASEFAWASLEDIVDEEAGGRRERVEKLETDLSEVRDHSGRLAAKADRREDHDRQVDRRRNEERSPVRSGTERSRTVSPEESAARQRRRKGRLWTCLKRQLF